LTGVDCGALYLKGHRVQRNSIQGGEKIVITTQIIDADTKETLQFY
jgi:hypothetical protein